MFKQGSSTMNNFKTRSNVWISKTSLGYLFGNHWDCQPNRIQQSSTWRKTTLKKHIIKVQTQDWPIRFFTSPVFPSNKKPEKIIYERNCSTLSRRLWTTNISNYQKLHKSWIDETQTLKCVTSTFFRRWVDKWIYYIFTTSQMSYFSKAGFWMC